MVDVKRGLEQPVDEQTAELTEKNEILLAQVLEHRRTEDALRQSQAAFQALLESAPDAIVSVDGEGKIVLVNGQTEKIFGYRRDELLGQPIEMLVPERFRDIHKWHRVQYDETPGTRPMGIGLDLAGRRQDGSEFPVEISLSPVHTAEGIQVMSIIRDVSDRQRAERALRQQAMRLQEQANLIELAHDTIIVRDMDDRITFWNHGAEEVYGWSSDQVMGQVTHTLLKTRSPLALEQIRVTLLRDGQWEGELVHTRRDGRDIIVSSRQVLEHDERGRPRAILEINRDVTQRKEAETRLSESESRFRTLVQQVRDYAILGLDAQGRVTSWNEGAERVYGYASAEIMGQPVSRLYGPPDPSYPSPEHNLEIAAAQGSYEEVGIRTRKDGARIWVDVVITALRDPSGNLRGFAKVTRDITERKATEEQIQKLNRELEHQVRELAAVNQELEAFSYSVSHDLRAPLRAIAGFSQALEEDYADVLDDQGRDYTRRVHAATQRLTQLIDDLLMLSRVTRSEMNQDTPVDLTNIAQSIVLQFQNASPERHVQVEIAPALIARGDPHLLRIALENLLGNAWKFTAKVADAHIEFGSVRAEKGQTTYFVRDNGAGFDMAYAAKLFGPFQRLHTTIEFPGTGIGLATVQRIIHRHGGKVWAESAVGHGATFYFSL